MSGLDLPRLSWSDMLDVLHFLFEEDNTYTSEEQMKSKLKMRESVYETLYDEPYKYKYGETKKNAAPVDYGVASSPTGDLDNLPYGEEGLTPFKPREQQPTKPYIPPTTFDPEAPKPFGTVLDAPLG